MKVKVPPGRYVLAVSGGVDSIVLLDLLAKLPGLELVVAHFNHGIRPESVNDEELVANRAKRLNLPLELGYASLGKGASEATARQVRYQFLEAVQKKHKAKAIITAHHQDDLIETAIINLLRGTGRQGLVAISSNKNVLRPLLNHSKKDILNYAKAHKLKWLDDTTNTDEIYLRNYVRQQVLVGLTDDQRQKLISNIDKVAINSQILDAQIAKISHNVYRNSTISRSDFINLPVELGNELIVHWLRDLKVSDFDKSTINRLSISLKTSQAGTLHPVKEGLSIKVEKKTARFTHTL
jgi:tRNA(Ile)-lysidine synthetase-like protein